MAGINFTAAPPKPDANKFFGRSSQNREVGLIRELVESLIEDGKTKREAYAAVAAKFAAM